MIILVSNEVGFYNDSYFRSESKSKVKHFVINAMI